MKSSVISFTSWAKPFEERLSLRLVISFKCLSNRRMLKQLFTGGFLKIWKYGPLRARNLNAEVLPAAPPSGLSQAQPMWTICRDAEDDIFEKNQKNRHNICSINRSDLLIVQGRSKTTAVRHLWWATFKRYFTVQCCCSLSCNATIDLGCSFAFL